MVGAKPMTGNSTARTHWTPKLRDRASANQEQNRVLKHLSDGQSPLWWFMITRMQSGNWGKGWLLPKEWHTKESGWTRREMETGSRFGWMDRTMMASGLKAGSMVMAPILILTAARTLGSESTTKNTAKEPWNMLMALDIQAPGWMI